MTRFLLAVGLAISVLVLTPSQAFACSCKMADFIEQAGWADQVVTGTVRAQNGSRTAPVTIYEVTVDGTYKGNLGPALTVTTASQGPACGVSLAREERYLLFLTGKGDVVTTDSCSGTTQLTEAVQAQVVAALGEPRVMKAAPTNSPTPEPGSGDVPAAESEPEDNKSAKIAVLGGALAAVAFLTLWIYRRRNELIS